MPCDYSKYPVNWHSEIRPRILARAGNKCEQCKVPNKANIARGMWGNTPVWQDDNGQIHSAIDGQRLGENGDLDGKVTYCTVVLTIAHTDNPDPMDCRDENLKALCQKCHNSLDAEMRRTNARQTRNKKKGLQGLF